MTTSRGIQRLDERLAAVPPGTLRHEALEAAKRFKASWIELGRALATVWRDKAFRAWGYLTFEAYCVQEMGIRVMTARKLVHSYGFLEREEPETLRHLTAGPPAALPHYEAVNVLRQLKQREGVAPQAYAEVRAQVLEQGREVPDVRRRVRALLEASAPDPEAARAARRQASLRRLIGTLKTLQQECAAAHFVPARLLTALETLTEQLDAVLAREGPG